MSENQPAIDFLILADRAEVVNGKLYMMGGGWDILSPLNAASPLQFSCALGILVPWLATNSDHLCALRMEDADGGTLVEMSVNFRTGRPPTMDQGTTQRVLIAIPLSMTFPASGAYVLVATVGTEEKRTRFEARLQQPVV